LEYKRGRARSRSVVPGSTDLKPANTLLRVETPRMPRLHMLLTDLTGDLPHYQEADGGRGEEVAAGVAGDGQLGPQPRAVLATSPLEEVVRGVPTLHPGGIDGRRGPLTDQAGLLGAQGGLEEEEDELPFFSSRAAA